MYGSIMRGRLRQGKRDEFQQLMCRLSLAHVAEQRGLLSVEMAGEDGDGDRVVMILRFEDRETYVRNADHPQTRRNYERWSALLDGDPEWIDVAFTDYIGEARTQSVVDERAAG
jgi:quinol monooxygenase YgiN